MEQAAKSKLARGCRVEERPRCYTVQSCKIQHQAGTGCQTRELCACPPARWYCGAGSWGQAAATGSDSLAGVWGRLQQVVTALPGHSGHTPPSRPPGMLSLSTRPVVSQGAGGHTASCGISPSLPSCTGVLALKLTQQGKTKSSITQECTETGLLCQVWDYGGFH